MAQEPGNGGLVVAFLLLSIVMVGLAFAVFPLPFVLPVILVLLVFAIYRTLKSE
jgi:cytochrome c oxidase assembly protein Cox11